MVILKARRGKEIPEATRINDWKEYPGIYRVSTSIMQGFLLNIQVWYRLLFYPKCSRRPLSFPIFPHKIQSAQDDQGQGLIPKLKLGKIKLHNLTITIITPYGDYAKLHSSSLQAEYTIIIFHIFMEHPRNMSGGFSWSLHSYFPLRNLLILYRIWEILCYGKHWNKPNSSK